MFGSFQLARTNYYSVPISIGYVEMRLLVEFKDGHSKHL